MIYPWPWAALGIRGTPGPAVDQFPAKDHQFQLSKFPHDVFQFTGQVTEARSGTKGAIKTRCYQGCYAMAWGISTDFYGLDNKSKIKQVCLPELEDIWGLGLCVGPLLWSTCCPSKKGKKPLILGMLKTWKINISLTGLVKGFNNQTLLYHALPLC